MCLDNLDLYVRGELSPEEMLAVESHVRMCGFCADQLRTEAQVEVLLVEIAENKAAAPVNNRRRVTAFLWAAIASFAISLDLIIISCLQNAESPQGAPLLQEKMNDLRSNSSDRLEIICQGRSTYLDLTITATDVIPCYEWDPMRNPES